MSRVHRLLAITCGLLVGCDSPNSLENAAEPLMNQAQSDALHVVFLTRDGCANTPVLLANLKAAAESLSPPATYEVLDQGTLPRSDARIGYATPTILFQDQDLFGLPAPVPPFPAPS